ncbi:DUF2946 family protein [Rhizobium sp. C4]|uniref:DUF2946 family protein n=1 Tax=Rhizobium sp. C4 TaxID=1349800 RepID=UPI001E5E2750|nr:DUF2946 family protein [Rhizobium sp. C4]MCD2173253.1 DUF2946 family protein [Rhizobium sp. C4]
MRHLSRLFLILCLLAGLAAAPAASFAAPAGHDQAAMMADGMNMHAHHGMQTEKSHAPATDHHGKHDAACAAWCAGVFLTALPRPAALFTASPTLQIHPARAEPLTGLVPAPPLQPPKHTLS